VCSPKCSPKAVEGVLNVGKLETLLAKSSVTLTTTGCGGTIQAYELDVGVQPRAHATPEIARPPLQGYNHALSRPIRTAGARTL
jgi:hypothetical protein